MVKIKTLENGLRIIVDEMPSMTSAAVGVWVSVGGRYENNANAGISHFIEHMVFKGSQNRTCQQIKEEIEGVGGYLNAFTSEEYTCYYAKVIGDEFSRALEVLSDMVLNPLFSQSDIDQERGVIIEEIKMYKDMPSHYVQEILDAVMWPKHPLGLFLTGTKETVTSFQKNDFLNYHQDYYSPNNIVVSCAGKVDFDRVVEIVEKIFEKTNKKNIIPFAPVTIKQKNPKIKIIKKKTEQTHMALGIKSYNKQHPLKYALGILNIVLGGNMSSRLYKEIREERGLAYEVRSTVTKYKDAGVFDISAGVENGKVKETLSVILKELDKLKKESVAADEFERARKYYVGGFLLQLEKTTERMLWTGEKLLDLDQGKTWEGSEKIISDIMKVKPEDLMTVANDIFNINHTNLAVIGPVKDKEEIENMLYEN